MAVSVLDETNCQLGEGPTYDPARDTAWWFDIVRKQLLQHDFATAATAVHDLPCMGCLLYTSDAADE